MARFAGGWVSIPREVLLDFDGRSYELGLFVRLVLLANYEEGSRPFTWKGASRFLQRGEVLTSLPDLADGSKESDRQKTRRALQLLENRQLIRQESNRNGRVITICDYLEKYVKGFPSDRQDADNPTQKCQNPTDISTDNPQYNNNKQYNKTKNKCVLSPEKFNSVSRFESQFGEKHKEFSEAFGEMGIWDDPKIRKRMPDILQTYENIETFVRNLERWRSSTRYPKDQSQTAKQSFVIGCILSDLKEGAA